MKALCGTPRIVIAATQSGSGKTTLTCGILSDLRRKGLRVQAYKAGPDYIDPGYLGLASGRPAHNLDTWLMDAPAMKRLFAETAQGADLAVIEGVMGLYDGGKYGVSSTAALAKELKAPVVLVIDAKSMGDSAAAVAVGFRDYDRSVPFRGVILNRLGSESHRQIVCEAMERVNIPVLGTSFRDPRLTLSERHLGLIPAEERSGGSFDELVQTAARSVDFEALLSIAGEAGPLEYETREPFPALSQAVIGVARDQAFSFYYPESLEELRRAGAEILFFSPLDSEKLPPADGLIFGGGFPEMFASRLSANAAMRRQVADAARRGMPIYAECGGYMYLTAGLTDFQGTRFPMAGCVPCECAMNSRLQTVGYVEATALKDTVLCPGGTVLRGHEFHFSSVTFPESEPPRDWAFQIVKKRTGESCRAGCASGNLLASYLHIHFAGNPGAARRFVQRCAQFHSLKSQK